jgi:hypothetical protein
MDGFTEDSENAEVNPMEPRRALANTELGEDSDVEVALDMAVLSGFWAVVVPNARQVI